MELLSLLCKFHENNEWPNCKEFQKNVMFGHCIDIVITASYFAFFACIIWIIILFAALQAYPAMGYDQECYCLYSQLFTLHVYIECYLGARSILFLYSCLQSHVCFLQQLGLSRISCGWLRLMVHLIKSEMSSADWHHCWTISQLTRKGILIDPQFCSWLLVRIILSVWILSRTQGITLRGEALVCMYKHACSRASHQNDNNPTTDSLSTSGTWHHPWLELGVQASKAEYVCINGVVIFVWLIVLRAQWMRNTYYIADDDWFA